MMGLERYQLLSQLAQGGMAETWRAELLGSAGVRKQVVLKKVLPNLASDATFIEAFVQEGRLAARLSHGNVVQVIDFGDAGDEYFLAMEWVDGSTVATLAKAMGGRLPLDLVLYVTTQVLEGLRYLHALTDEQGRPLHVVHRDISPDNVLLSWDGDVKIADFGVARAALAGRPETRPGLAKGKLPFMSPEQMEGKRVDAQSDLYAVGVMAYQLLTGRYPFTGEPFPMLERKRASDYPPLRTLRPDLPAEVERSIASALEGDKARRATSAEALHRALTVQLNTRWPDASRALVRDALTRTFREETTHRAPTRQLATPAGPAPDVAPPQPSTVNARGPIPAPVPSGRPVLKLVLFSALCIVAVAAGVLEGVRRRTVPAEVTGAQQLSVQPRPVAELDAEIARLRTIGQGVIADALEIRVAQNLEWVRGDKHGCVVAGRVVVPLPLNAQDLSAQMEILHDGWFVDTLKDCRAGFTFSSMDVPLTEVRLTGQPPEVSWLGEIPLAVAGPAQRGTLKGHVMMAGEATPAVVEITSAAPQKPNTLGNANEGSLGEPTHVRVEVGSTDYWFSPPFAQGPYWVVVTAPGHLRHFVHVDVAAGEVNLLEPMRLETARTVHLSWLAAEDELFTHPYRGTRELAPDERFVAWPARKSICDVDFTIAQKKDQLIFAGLCNNPEIADLGARPLEAPKAPLSAGVKLGRVYGVPVIRGHLYLYKSARDHWALLKVE
jgi:serine/threonine protein kinase